MVKGLKSKFPKGDATPFKIAWWHHNETKKKSMKADMHEQTPNFASDLR